MLISQERNQTVFQKASHYSIQCDSLKSKLKRDQEIRELSATLDKWKK